jgi:hypothetical protein
MAHFSLSSGAHSPSRLNSLHSKRIWIGVVIAIMVAVLAIGFVEINAHWPYRYRVVKPLLEDVLGGQLQITHYHRTYFPHPGFAATGIVLRRKSALDIPPLGSVDTLFVQGSWIDLLLLRQRVTLVDMTGVHIVVPVPGSRANKEDFPPGSAQDFSGPDALIETLRLHASVLDIMRADGRPFSFPIRELELRNFTKGRQEEFNVDMFNALPKGHIEANGYFGPLNANDLSQTPASGTFKFTSINLSDVGEIHGTMSSAGSFTGTLSSLQTTVATDTPDFAVENGKSTHISASVQAAVNGMSGDVTFHEIRANEGATTMVAQGAVSGSPKVTDFEIRVENGRAEDLLRPFISEEVPITGPVWLSSRAHLAPSDDHLGFLQRLQVDGEFTVPAEQLTNKSDAKSLAAFSDRAQEHDKKDEKNTSSEPARDEISSLKGPAQIRDGIVSSRRLVFEIAGAEATLNGTFNLHNKNVHLTGLMTMQSDFSHVTTGFKSALLKPIAPFMRKKNAGAVVPIAVTGSPGKYKVSLDFSHK